MSDPISDEQLEEWQALAAAGLDTAYAVDAHGRPLECMCDARVLHAIPGLIAEVRRLRDAEANWRTISGHMMQARDEACAAADRLLEANREANRNTEARCRERSTDG